MPLVFDEEAPAAATGGRLVFDDEAAAPSAPGRLVFDDEVGKPGLIGTTINAVRQGGAQILTGVVGGAAKLLDEGSRLVADTTGLRRGGFFGDVAGFMDDVQAESARLYPVNPRHEIASTIAGGATQAVGLMASGGPRAALTLAGLMGAGQGIDTAKDIGIENPAARLAMGAGFGGLEAGIERLGGIGAPVKAGAKELLKGALKETVEEPLTGIAQDALTRLAATEDPQRPGFTKNGYDLAELNPENASYWNKRKLEAIGGAAGGAVFAGVQALAGRGQEAVDAEGIPEQGIRQEAAGIQPEPPSPNPQPPSSTTIETTPTGGRITMRVPVEAAGIQPQPPTTTAQPPIAPEPGVSNAAPPIHAGTQALGPPEAKDAGTPSPTGPAAASPATGESLPEAGDAEGSGQQAGGVSSPAVPASDGGFSEGQTAIKNANVNAFRESVGLDPLDTSTPQTEAQWWEDARQTLADDKTAAERIISRIETDGYEALPHETAVLIHHEAGLRQKMNAARDAVLASQRGSPEAAAAKRVLDELTAQVQRAHEAYRTTGTISGQNLRARKMWLRDDFDFATMWAEWSGTAKPGDMEKVAAMSREIQQSLDAVDAVETAQAEAEAEIDLAADDPILRQEAAALADDEARVKAALTERMTAAEEFIKRKLGVLAQQDEARDVVRSNFSNRMKIPPRRDGAVDVVDVILEEGVIQRPDRLERTRIGDAIARPGEHDPLRELRTEFPAWYNRLTAESGTTIDNMAMMAAEAGVTRSNDVNEFGRELLAAIRQRIEQNREMEGADPDETAYDAHMARLEAEALAEEADTGIDPESIVFERKAAYVTAPVEMQRTLVDKITPQALLLEQPQASYGDKQKLLLDFSESILGDQSPAGTGSDAGRLAALQVIRQRFAKEIETNLRVDFIGAKISGPEDLVKHAQALRNPLFETFYLFALKENGEGQRVIKDVMAVTARVPASAAVFSDGKGWTAGMAEHEAFLKNAGADSYILLHNHPSGDPSPSQADRALTVHHAAHMKARGLHFLDHLVINHLKYFSLDASSGFSRGKIKEADVPDPFALTEFAASAPVFLSPEDLINSVKAMTDAKAEPGTLLAFFVTVKRQVAAQAHGSLDAVLAQTHEQLQSYGLSQGANELMLHARAESKQAAEAMLRSLQPMNSDGRLYEAVVEYDNGFISGIGSGYFTESDKSRFFGGEENMKGVRVQEDEPAYRTPQAAKRSAAEDAIRKNLVTYMAGLISSGAKDANEMVRRTKESFGAAVERFDLEALAGEAAGTYGRLVNKAREARTPAGVLGAAKAKLGGGAMQGIDPALVRQLALAHIAARPKIDRNQIVTAVTKDLREVQPELTEREVRDALTGYGRMRKPSQDAVKARLRELNAQNLIVSKLEDALKGQQPLRTGLQRGKASDEVRALTSRLKDVLAKLQVPATAEEQLATAQDAIKSRLRNQISDIKAEMAGTKPPREPRARVAYDAEMTALAKERDALQAQLDALNDPTGDKTWNARAEAAAKASEAHYRRKIARGDLSSRTVPQPHTATIKTLAAKDEARRAKEEWQALRESAGIPTIEAVNRTEAGLRRRQRDIKQEIERSRKGQPPDPAKPRLTSAEIENLRRENASLARLLAIMDERHKPKAKRDIASDAERAARAERAAERELGILEAEIANDGISLRQRQPDFIPTARLRGLQAMVESLRGVRDAMRAAKIPRRSADEIALANAKKRIAAQTRDYERRLREKDYSQKTRKEIMLDEKGREARFKLNKLREQWLRLKVEHDLAQRDLMGKALGGVQEILNTSRALLTSVDVSAPLRQGGFIALAHPVRAARALAPMFKAFASERAQHAEAEKLERRENSRSGLYQKAGLYLADAGEMTLARMEEQFMSRWIAKMPRWIGGGLVRGSQRAYTTFLNRLRADSFDAMAAGLSKDGTPTVEEARAIANFVNVATGRGAISKKFDRGAEVLNTVFFAPRYVVSRFNLLSGQPLWHGNARTRKMIAGEYARYILGASAMLGLAALAFGGDDEDDPLTVEADPRSADFGKVKIGNTRIDLLSGLSQAAVLSARMATGETKTLNGEIRPLREGLRPLERWRSVQESIPGGPRFNERDALGVLGRFARSKFSPAFGTGVNLLTGKDMNDDPVTPASELVGMVTPLSVREVRKVLEDQGAAKGIPLVLLNLLGAGVQVYKPSGSVD